MSDRLPGRIGRPTASGWMQEPTKTIFSEEYFYDPNLIILSSTDTGSIAVSETSTKSIRGPLWATDATTGGSSALSVTSTLPGSGVSADDIVFVVVSGVTVAPASLTATGSTGTLLATIQPLTTATNLWWAAYAFTGCTNSSTITISIPSGAKYMTMSVVGYQGSSLGNYSSVYARSSNINTTTLPAFTLSDSSSTVVDLWAERNVIGDTYLAVDTGAIADYYRISGTTGATCSTGISDYTPGSTSAGAVVGTYTDGLGTARNSTNGTGLQVELVVGTVVPSTPISSTDTGSVAVSESSSVTTASGANVFRNGAEGQTSGTNVTTANSDDYGDNAFTSVNLAGSGTVKYDSTYPGDGSMGFAITPTSSTTFVTLDISPSDNACAEFVYYHNGNPSVTHRLLSFMRSGGSGVASFTITTGGYISVLNSLGSQVAISASPLVSGHYYRFSIRASIGTTGTVLLTYYDGAQSTTPVESDIGSTSANLNTYQIYQARFGSGTNSAIGKTVYLDSIQFSDTFDQIGPYPGYGVTGTLVSLRSGGVGTTTAKVGIDTADTTSAIVRAATDTGLTTGIVNSSSVTIDANGLGIATLTGLSANTTYYYGVLLDGTLTADRGNFRTKSTSTAQSFSFAAASCMDTNDDDIVLDFIRTRTGAAGATAEFFAHLGDLEYKNTSSSSASSYISNFRGVLSKTKHKAFFAALPVEYTVSDHDAWGDNCDAASAATGVVAAWRDANARFFPTYDYPTVNTDSAPYRSWVIGRVRFIMTDGRTYMDGIAATDNSSKSKLGATQKQWVKDETLTAASAGQVVVVFMEDGGWTQSSTYVGDDSWARYTNERDDIVSYWNSISMADKVLIVHGDFHAMAADDGTNAPSNIPSVCASPLSQTYYMPSQDHWSEGVYPATSPGVKMHQYGWFDVVDSGGSTLNINFTGYSNDGTTDTSRITLNTTFTPGGNSYSTTDTGSVAVAETSSTAVTISTTDTGSIAVSDSASLLKTIPTTDTGSISVAETSSTLKTIPSSDTTAISVSETSSAAISLSRTDTGSIALAETSTMTISLSTTDSGSLSVGETSSISKTSSTTDTGSLAVAESSSIISYISTIDSGTVSVSETVSSYGTVSAVDSGSISISETSGFAASTVSGSTSGSLAVSETCSISATVASTDAGAISITESSSASGTAPGLDSVGIGISESSSIFVTSTTTDTGSLGAAEAMNAYNSFSSTDSGSLLVSESYSADNAYNASDAGTISIAENSSVYVTQPTIDSGSIAVSETTSGYRNIASDDTGSISTSESNAILVTLSSIDTGNVAVTETRIMASYLSRTDTGSIANTSVVSLAVSLSRTDTGSISQTSTASNAVFISRSDTGSISVSETASSSGTVAGSDNVSIGVIDTSNPGGGALGTDNVYISIVDAASIYGTMASTDAGSLAVAESSALGVQQPTVDAGSILVAESVTTIVAFGTGDSGALGASETVAIWTAPAAATAGSLGVSETSSIVVSVSSSDEAAISLTEDNSSFNTYTTSDTGAISITETAQIAGTVNSTDAGSISVGEVALPNPGDSIANETIPLIVTEQATILVTLAAATSGAISVSESRSIGVIVSRVDSGAVGVIDSNILHNSFTKTDTGSISISESTSIAIGGTVTKGAIDAGSISVSETHTTTSGIVVNDTTYLSITETVDSFSTVDTTDSANISVDDIASVFKDDNVTLDKDVSEDIGLGIEEVARVAKFYNDGHISLENNTSHVTIIETDYTLDSSSIQVGSERIGGLGSSSPKE